MTGSLRRGAGVGGRGRGLFRIFICLD